MVPRSIAFALNSLYIDTITIISNFDDNVVTFLISIKEDRTNFRLAALARTSADSRPWSAELRSRCIRGSPISSTTVRSSSVSSPVMIQFHLLAELLGKISDHTRELLNGTLNGNHSNLHDGLVQICRNALKIFDLLVKF